jgi:hypothetical protein
MTDCCRTLCGSAFATQLRADNALMQMNGLNQMDAKTRQDLLDRYEPEVSNPYAQEIAGWLRNEYLFDPQCLTA